MKKQILTLTMCLALTATSALANGTKTVAKSITPQAKVSTTIAKPTSVPNVINIGEPPKLMDRAEARKHFESQKAKERELLYSALNLTAEQKAKAEAIDAKTRAEAGSYLKKVQTEARKLRELKTKKASFFAIYKQKVALKMAKTDANNYFADSRKSFESILTKEQKAKFKTIDEARKAEMYKFKKEHKHHGKKGGRPHGPKGPHGPELMGPPSGPAPQGSEFVGPHGPHGPAPIGPPPEDKK